MPDKGVEKIISHIDADAEKEISEILRKAQAEADTITKTAQEKATRESEKILSNGKRIASLEGQKIIAETRINVRRKRMDAQEEAIAASFEEAKKVLEELAEKGKQNSFMYKDIMFSLISSASEIVAGNKLELVFNQRDSKTFNKKMLEELTTFVKNKIGREISLALSHDTIQCLGGVLVRDLDNQVEVDQTLETKLDRLKENLRVDVAKILFGDRI
ncbi:MAG: V-type ATP synthase subunit E [Thermodesulfobacteriota bacterium]